MGLVGSKYLLEYLQQRARIGSRQAGKGDRSMTESQTKRTNKAFDKLPIVLKPAVS